MNKSNFLQLLTLIYGSLAIYAQTNISDIEPAAYVLPSPPPFKGPLTPNSKLTNVEFILNGTILGDLGVFSF